MPHLGSLGGVRGKGICRVSFWLMLWGDVTLMPSPYVIGPLVLPTPMWVENLNDYILADVDATSRILSCQVLPMTDLNTSDQLEANLDFEQVCRNTRVDPQPCFDWQQVVKSGEILTYCNLSCADAATQDVVARYLPGGSRVYMISRKHSTLSNTLSCWRDYTILEVTESVGELWRTGMRMHHVELS